MNDSSSTSLEKQRQGLEIFIFISDLFELVTYPKQLTSK